MESIMMSMKPKLVEKILSGEVTVVVLKRAPKCGTPFKEYIYCTKAEKLGGFYRRKREIMPVDDCNEIVLGTKEMTRLDGYVVGEFVCNCITDFMAYYDPFNDSSDPFYMPCGYEKRATCLTNEQFVEYGKGAPLYGLHISELKFYDEPKALYEFNKVCKMPKEVQCENCPYCDWNAIGNTCFARKITRPPMSWCYVEGK